MLNGINIHTTHAILYVEDQQKSANFYQHLLLRKPQLNVEGMTEFKISENFILGLMPSKDIAQILSGNIIHPDKAKGIPRCELYFYVDDLQSAFDNALRCGAKLISDIEDRNWGDKTCYFADLDGHIIAFAKKQNK